MVFTFICHTSAVSEGGMGLFHAGKKSVLLVWPTGGELDLLPFWPFHFIQLRLCPPITLFLRGSICDE